jgi:hypothetical protein
MLKSNKDVMHKIKMLYPRCEQDYLYKARIVPLNMLVYLCAECDALWELEVAIVKQNYVDFGNFMKGYGYSGDWSLIDVNVLS